MVLSFWECFWFLVSNCSAIVAWHFEHGYLHPFFFLFSSSSSSLLFSYIMHLFKENQRLAICFSCLQSAQSPDVSRTWYPPLEKTISCLSKLYRCLEPAVFTGLAQVLVLGLSLDFLVDYISGYSLSLFLNQEAVEVCASSIQVSVSRFMFIIRREGRRHHFKHFLKKAYDACLKWALLIKMLWNFWTSIHIIDWCISLKLLDDWVLVLDHDIV